MSVHAVEEWPSFGQGLGPGEHAVIALTIQTRATFAVLDDWEARVLAISQGIGVIGSLGLLVRAKSHGLIPLVQPLMDDMMAHGLNVSDRLYVQILTISNERPCD